MFFFFSKNCYFLSVVNLVLETVNIRVSLTLRTKMTLTETVLKAKFNSTLSCLIVVASQIHNSSSENIEKSSPHFLSIGHCGLINLLFPSNFHIISKINNSRATSIWQATLLIFCEVINFHSQLHFHPFVCLFIVDNDKCFILNGSS